MKIHPVELAELHVKKAPALRRSLLDDPQILRGEEYKVRDAKKLAGPADGDAVHRDSLALIFLQVDIDLVFQVPPADLGADMGLLFPETDQIPIPAPPVGCLLYTSRCV